MSRLVPRNALVIPAHNEEGVIEELAARLVELMDALDGDAEAILGRRRKPAIARTS